FSRTMRRSMPRRSSRRSGERRSSYSLAGRRLTYRSSSNRRRRSTPARYAASLTRGSPTAPNRIESAFCSSAHVAAGTGSPVRRYWSALTSYSWKSKSAPAARRTLIASGTTSWPAPSHGKTAMCSGRGCFIFAQLVTLDLAGHGLGQLRHELDDVRVLKSLQARLHVLLQLDDQRVTGCGVGPRNHERFDLREPFDRDPYHRALSDGGMLEQRRLDLDG